MVGTDRQSGGVSAEKGEKRVILSFTCNGLTRRIQRLENAVVAVRQDSNVDTVRMIFRPEEYNNINLASVSVKFLYVDTDGEIKAYQTGTTPDGGVYVADWELTDDVVDDAGYINFAVKLAVVNGDTVEKQWFSIPDTFRVYDSVDDTNNPPGETAAEQATNAEKIAQLQSQLGTATSELASLTSTVALQGAALDTIGANYKNLGASTAIPSNSDLNNYTTPGSYSAQSNTIAATITNAPITRAFTLDVENALGLASSAWRRQVLRAGATPDDVYQRFTGGNTWSDWEKVPTRAEVDTLNLKVSDSTQIRSGSFNDLVDTGYYFVYPEVANSPDGGTTYYWRVKVENYSGAQNQYANRNGSSDLYLRYKANNVWSVWIKLF
jgi:hypothetical protein